MEGNALSLALAYLAAGIGAGLAIIGGSAGIGRLAASAMEGIARQPNSAGEIRLSMIVAAGLIITILLALKS
jgi:F-type H+-transporting ATPase subunit c